MPGPSLHVIVIHLEPPGRTVQDTPSPVETTDTSMFINRELSARLQPPILGEAQDARLSLYERVRFLSIASANLDEFFMVRVAGIKQQPALGVTATEADGPPRRAAPGDHRRGPTWSGSSTPSGATS